MDIVKDVFEAVVMVSLIGLGFYATFYPVADILKRYGRCLAASIWVLISLFTGPFAILLYWVFFKHPKPTAE